MRFINVFGSSVGKEELDEIKTSINNQWLGMGKKVESFEKIFSERLGQKFILIDNCSNGLYLAVKLLNLPEGSEVIVPANTWVSCATAVILNNCIPVFADCDFDTLNIHYGSILNVITDKTKAIMLTHYSGYPVDVKELKEFELPIIEDCAHAVDSKINSRWCGTLGNIGLFSFDSMKNIACGELGGFTSADEYIMDMAVKSRYCGLTKSGLQASTEKNRWWEYELNNYCIKMLPNDIMASIALAQYHKLDKLQKRRKEIWDRYNEEFKIGYRIPHNIRHSYFTYFICRKNRDGLAQYLLRKGIYTTVRYSPLHLLFKDYYRGSLPVAEYFGKYGLNLPLHPNLTDNEVDYIIENVKNFN